MTERTGRCGRSYCSRRSEGSCEECRRAEENYSRIKPRLSARSDSILQSFLSRDPGDTLRSTQPLR